MDKIEKLLRITARPQDHTDEELERVLADDQMWEYYELMLCAEQGFAARRQQKHSRGLMIRRMAASIAVILTLSGIAFATLLHFQGGTSDTREPISIQQSTPNTQNAKLKTQNADADSLRLYKDVELAEILSEVATYYHVTVSYQQERSKHLRLYTRWRKSESLSQVIERLNGFEKVNIVQHGGQLAVE